MEQLRERRDKLRERLKRGPHEIVQEYLKMSRFDILHLLNTLFHVFFHLCDFLVCTYLHEVKKSGSCILKASTDECRSMLSIGILINTSRSISVLD